MKILLLGHTGFLGSAVFQLLAKNQDLELFGRSKSNGFDLRDFEMTSEVISTMGPDVIINCSSYVGGIQFGLTNKSDLYFNNMLMNISLFRALQESDVKQIIHPISNCTYPHEFDVYDEEKWWDGPMHESVEIYGFSKKAIFIASKAIAGIKLKSTQLVFPNLYGPNDHMSEFRAHALGALCLKFVRARIEEKKSIDLWGTGKPVREWLHVVDAADAIVKSIGNDLPDRPINVSTATGLSILDLAKKIRSIVDPTIKISLDDTKEDGAYSKLLKPSTFINKLGWAPKMNIDAGLIETIKSYEMRLLSVR